MLDVSSLCVMLDWLFLNRVLDWLFFHRSFNSLSLSLYLSISLFGEFIDIFILFLHDSIIYLLVLPDECSESMYTVLDEVDRVEAGGKDNFCDNTDPTSFKNVHDS